LCRAWRSGCFRAQRRHRSGISASRRVSRRRCQS
jgi:hypothetical protein